MRRAQQRARRGRGSSVDGLAGPGPRAALVRHARAAKSSASPALTATARSNSSRRSPGLRPATRGLDPARRPRTYAARRVAGRVGAGLAYMPADRASTALVKSMSIAENLMLRDSRRPPFARARFFRLRVSNAARRSALMRGLRHPRAVGRRRSAARLSGGNQQKIVVARELDRKPAALIAHQAAWGLDPGATRFVLDGRLLCATRARRSSISRPNSRRCSTSPTASR